VRLIRISQHPFHFQSFSSSASKAKGRDNYSKAQRKAHDAAVQSRRKRHQINQEPGDPIRGIQTEFVRSFSEPVAVPSTEVQTSQIEKGQAVGQVENTENSSSSILNYGIPTERLQQRLQISRQLTFTSRDPTYIPPATEAEAYNDKVNTALEVDLDKDRTATEAVKRILGAGFESSKDRQRRNIDKCIETFGRHNTDSILPAQDGGEQIATFRAGKDTGSSEVQIAILTAKINNLASALQQTGKHDKHNKRNLQLFVHKRQKLLRYLRRKEKGGPRWQNLISTLGLTEATWQGQINI
jgi:ribosomal protein S15